MAAGIRGRRLSAPLKPRPIASDAERFGYFKAGKMGLGWLVECDNAAQAETLRAAYPTYATLVPAYLSPYKGVYSSTFVRLPFPVFKEDWEAIESGLKQAGIQVPDKVRNMGHEAIRRAHERFLLSKLPNFGADGGGGYATGFLRDGYAPLPFQEVAIEYTRKMGYRGIIGDDMGLGKTMSGICVLFNASQGRKLIVTKNSLTPSFYARLKEWTGKTESEMAVAVSATGKARKGPGKHPNAHPEWLGLKKYNVPFDADIDRYEVLIVHYAILKKWLPRLMEWKPEAVVFDEAHTLCNPDSLLTQSARRLSEQVDSVVAMTGTPGSNRPRELFHLFDLVFPYRFGDFHHYGLRFCDAHLVKQPRTVFNKETGRRETKQVEVMDYDGASNLKELFYRLRATGMVRRLKNDVMAQIPFEDIPMVLPVSDEYWAREEECVRKVQEARSKGETESLLSKLLLLAAEEKIKWASEWIPDFLENRNGPLVVFFHHNSAGDALREFARDKGIKTMCLYGNHKDDDFEHRFQTDEGVELALVSYAIGRDGLTLTRSAHMLLLEYSWVPGWIDQAKDRLRRYGQERLISYYCPYLEGTTDERVVECVVKKKDILSAVMDNRSDTVLPHFGSM